MPHVTYMDKATIDDKEKFMHPAQVKFYSELIFIEQMRGYKRAISY